MGFRKEKVKVGAMLNGYGSGGLDSQIQMNDITKC